MVPKKRQVFGHSSFVGGDGDAADAAGVGGVVWIWKAYSIRWTKA